MFSLNVINREKTRSVMLTVEQANKVVIPLINKGISPKKINDLALDEFERLAATDPSMALDFTNGPGAADYVPKGKK